MRHRRIYLLSSASALPSHFFLKFPFCPMLLSPSAATSRLNTHTGTFPDITLRTGFPKLMLYWEKEDLKATSPATNQHTPPFWARGGSQAAACPPLVCFQPNFSICHRTFEHCSPPASHAGFKHPWGATRG